VRSVNNAQIKTMIITNNTNTNHTNHNNKWHLTTVKITTR